MPSNSTARRTSVASPGARDRRPPWAGRRVTPDSAATAPALPGPLKCWVLGARPRTLPAAIVPVVVGTAAAHPLSPRAGAVGVYVPLVHQAGAEVGVWWRALGALVVALAIQVGTNYANDYSDGIRGTDDDRVGPLRLVASGLASPSAVKRAALLSFGVAGVAGLALAWATSWWILVVGAACLAAGWLYTGGPRPYGYAGLGEVFVFAFFGLVATVGTYYVQTLRMDQPVVWFAAVVVGLLATALLLANNLRDIETDRETGKHTLAVRVGRRAAVRGRAGLGRVVGHRCRRGGPPGGGLPPAARTSPGAGTGAAGDRRRLGSRAPPGAGGHRSAAARLGRPALRVALAVDLVTRSGRLPATGPGMPADERADLAGPLQMGRMAGLRDHHMGGVGADGLRHPATQCGELVIALTGDDQDGHLQSAEPVPQRLLGACPGQAETCGQPRRGVAQPLVEAVGFRADAGEERVGQPPAEEHLDCFASRSRAPGRVEFVGQGLVRQHPGPALDGAVGARCSRDQHQSLHRPGLCHGRLQAVPRSHRVADIGGLAAGLDQQPGPVGQTGHHRTSNDSR